MATSMKDAVRAAFTAIRDGAKGERFYFHALFTTEDGSYAVPTALSEEALARVVAASRKRDKRRTEEELARSLRFSAPDSPYQGAELEGVRSGKKLHDGCFAALAALDAEGFFGKGAARAKVIVNVVYGDMSDERWLAHAERLNPKAAIAKVKPLLRLNLPSGRVAQWGKGAYQANALSLSADRKIVAYSGSGGEVGVLRVAGKKAVFEKARKGEHWASVLSPDGARLYLGDKDGIGVLDPRTGEVAPFARTGKPGALAITPDGALLAASSWDAPLRVFDARGKRVWEDKAIRRAAIAFSPCGKWLAVGDARAEKGAWSGTVAVRDAATGKARWSTKVGAAYTVALAWSPDGGELLVSASKRIDLGQDASRASVVAFHDAKKGKRGRVLPWTHPVDAVALSPSGARVAIASKKTLVVLGPDGAELARGTGTQEQIARAAFVDEATVLAVGRDVNRGPAILELRVE